MNDDWEQICRDVRAHQPEAENLLYATLRRYLGAIASRIRAAEPEDLVQIAIIVVFFAIIDRSLRDERKVLAFAKSTLLFQRRTMAAQSVMRDRLACECEAALYPPPETPEHAAMESQKRRQARSAIATLRDVKRQRILTGFYLEGKSQQELMSELDLSTHQFGLLKNRAKEQILKTKAAGGAAL